MEIRLKSPDLYVNIYPRIKYNISQPKRVTWEAPDPLDPSLHKTVSEHVARHGTRNVRRPSA
jgi:hypothetical protein